jgi:hypothetical protein
MDTDCPLFGIRKFKKRGGEGGIGEGSLIREMKRMR